MKITFTVDRAAAIRGGFNQDGKISLDVDVSKLDQADRDLLAKSLDYDGNVTKVVAPLSTRVVYISAEAPNAMGLVLAVRAAWEKVAAMDAEYRRKQDEELALTEREDARALAGRRLKQKYAAPGMWEIDHGDGQRVLNYAKDREGELKTRNSPEWAAWVKEIDQKNREELAAAELQRLKERIVEVDKDRRMLDKDRRTLAEFLAEIPQDALRGTLKRLAVSEESIAAMESKIEDASPVTIFEQDEAEA